MLFFGDSGNGGYQLRQGGADSYERNSYDPFWYSQHSRQQTAVVDQQIRTDDDSSSAEDKSAH